MPERIANIFVLAEDIEQQNLVRRYMENCGHNLRSCRFDRPAQGPSGSGEKYVRDQYPKQVQACRSAIGRRASALLVIIIDSDMETTQHRAEQLADALEAAGMQPRDDGEPIVVLIPKRHVETWIRALLGNQADEQIDYKKPQPIASDIRNAAEILHRWTRRGAGPGPTSPPSLTASLPQWRKIPS